MKMALTKFVTSDGSGETALMPSLTRAIAVHHREYGSR